VDPCNKYIGENIGECLKPLLVAQTDENLDDVCDITDDSEKAQFEQFNTLVDTLRAKDFNDSDMESILFLSEEKFLSHMKDIIEECVSEQTLSPLTDFSDLLTDNLRRIGSFLAKREISKTNLENEIKKLEQHQTIYETMNTKVQESIPTVSARLNLKRKTCEDLDVNKMLDQALGSNKKSAQGGVEPLDDKSQDVATAQNQEITTNIN